jgi:hypothetical protein
MDEWKKFLTGRHLAKVYVDAGLVAYIWGAAFYALPLRQKLIGFVGDLWSGHWVAYPLFGAAAFLFLVWLIANHESGDRTPPKLVALLFALTTLLYAAAYAARHTLQ